MLLFAYKLIENQYYSAAMYSLFLTLKNKISANYQLTTK